VAGRTSVFAPLRLCVHELCHPKAVDKSACLNQNGLSFDAHPLKYPPDLGMRLLASILRTPNRRIAAIGALVVVFDQLTKLLVRQCLGTTDEKVVVDGFFKFVHWHNTGAAWSLFRGNNALLALIAVVALVVLFFSRSHFEARTTLGQTAFGLICGGIVGNLIDRIVAGHVIDFLYFYVQRGGREVSFPAFNVADSAICTGVALVFLITWKNERTPKAAESSASEHSAKP
jgi:signal peptidase II